MSLHFTWKNIFSNFVVTAGYQGNAEWCSYETIKKQSAMSYSYLSKTIRGFSHTRLNRMTKLRKVLSSSFSFWMKITLGLLSWWCVLQIFNSTQLSNLCGWSRKWSPLLMFLIIQSFVTTPKQCVFVTSSIVTLVKVRVFNMKNKKFLLTISFKFLFRCFPKDLLGYLALNDHQLRANKWENVTLIISEWKKEILLVTSCSFVLYDYRTFALLKGWEYIGSVNRTKEGDFCQPWQSNMPNFGFDFQKLPQVGEEGNHNNCRNLAGAGFRKPWCYPAVDRGGNKVPLRVECNVPRCHDCIYGKGDGNYPGS